jgi:surface protein
MATARPFAYNTGSAIAGTEQIGDLAIGFPTNGFSSTELQWWNGPDEDLGYVIAASNPGGTRPTPVPGVFASVGFFRSAEKNENSFVALANVIQNGSTAPFTTGSEARTWLNINGYWTSYPVIVNQTFVSEWTTSSSNETIVLPLVSNGTYSFEVDWGDGNTQTITNYDQRSHTYTTAGNYTISIDGTIEGWNFNTVNTSKDKIKSILSWGSLKLSNTPGQFAFCSNLDISNVTDTLNLTGITTLQFCFAFCDSLYGIANINSWNMSAITDIGLMFYNSPNFNSPVGNWNTSSVTYAAAVFRNALPGQFNQPINNWDMGGVTDLTEMFANCVNFNQDLSSWDVSSVTSMYQMFAGCSSFNQDLSSWNVSSVTNMNATFFYCVVYNQPLNTWNVSSVTDMGQMFNGAKKFNQPLGSWNVCSVSNMILMFETAEEFDQNISAWTVPLIGSKPFWFDENTPVTWTEGEKPQWGVPC